MGIGEWGSGNGNRDPRSPIPDPRSLYPITTLHDGAATLARGLGRTRRRRVARSPDGGSAAGDRRCARPPDRTASRGTRRAGPALPSPLLHFRGVVHAGWRDLDRGPVLPRPSAARATGRGADVRG